MAGNKRSFKQWQVNINYYGTEVLLNREYFYVHRYDMSCDRSEYEDKFCWDYWVDLACAQSIGKLPVMWKKGD